MAAPKEDYDFSSLFPEASDEEQRKNNTGKYQRTPWYYAKANARELANNFTGNPDRIWNAKNLGDVAEGVTPGALSGLYSLADTVQMSLQDLVNSNTPGPEMTGGAPREATHLPGGETATRMYQESRDAASRTFGVEEIEGTVDFAAGALPSFLIPGPKIPKATSLLGKVGTTAAALTLPFAQSKIGTVRHGVEAALPIGIAEGAAAAGDLSKEQYDSLFRSDERPEDEDFDFSGLFNPDDISNEEFGSNPASDDYTREAQFAAGTSLALTAAYLATKRIPLFHQKHVPHPDQIQGEMGTMEALPATTHAKTAFLDKHAAFADAARKTGMPDEQVKAIESEMNAMLNPVPQANIGATALDSGIFPGVPRRLTPLTIIQRTVGRFSPEDKDLYSRAMSALDMESRMRPGQIITAPDGSQWSQARLAAIIAQARALPRVAAQIARTRQWFDDMREALHVTGIIDAANHAEWGAKHPHFIHTQIKHVPKDGPIAQLMHSIGAKYEGPIPDSAVVRSLTHRNLDPQHGVLPGMGEDPLVLMKKYGESVIRSILENNAKRRFFRKIEHFTGGNNAGLFKKVKEPNANTISYFESGQQVHYDVRDAALRNAMLNQPVMVVPILNGVRAMAHFFITGAGNPLFVTKAAAYDTLLAPIMRMKGDSLGPLDELVRKASGGKFDVSNTFGIDPTAIANWPVGSARYLWGAFTKEMKDRLESSIQADTTFARSLSAIGVNPQGLLRVIDNAYMQSNHFLFNSLGGGTNGALMLSPENYQATLASTAPEVIKHIRRVHGTAPNPKEWMRRRQAGFTAHSAWRAYSALMNSLHIGTKFQHFAANSYKIAGETAAAERQRMINSAKATRELNLDASRTGDSPIYRGYASVSLYGNVGVQSLYQASRAIKDHPLRFALMTTGLGVSTFAHLNQMFGSDPEAADKYYKEMTAQQRVQNGIPVARNENGDFEYYPVDPMMRTVTAVATELYGAIAGHTSQMPRDDERLSMIGSSINQMFGTNLTEHQDDIILGGVTTALAQGSPGADVPAFNIVMKNMGMTPQNSMPAWLMQRGDMYTPEKDSAISPLEDRTVNAVVPKLLENILTETMGRTGKMIVDGVNTFSRVLATDASPLTAVDAVVEQYEQSAKDINRGQPIQSLWTKQTNDKKLDTYNEIARRNRMSMDGIEQVMKWGEKGITGANTTGGRVKMALPGTNVDASGDKMFSLYTAVAPFRKQLQMPTELLNDLRKQLEDVETSPLLALRQDDRRARVNELKTHILEQQHVIYAAIQQFEDAMSVTLGQPVRLNALDMDDWIDSTIQQPQPLPPQQ